MPALIECQNACFGYGREPVLAGVNLTVPKAVFWPIVGPNGAGKTTLLRGLLGLLVPQAGRVTHHLDGKPPGYVPQGWKLDPIYPLTVGEVVLQGRFAGQPWHKRASSEDVKTSRAALRRLHIEDVWDRNYRDLSGGTRQKVLIARALATTPSILLLDEPTSEVDKPSEIDILEHLHRLHHESRMTVLLVCHAIGTVFDYADACLVVDHGQITFAQGKTLEHIRERYV